MPADFTYEIVKTLGVVPSGGSMALELNLIKWGKHKPMLDLRKWNDTHTSMGKGFTLSQTELKGLCNMLNNLDDEI